VGLQRGERHLQRVAAPDEHAQRPIAVAPGGRRRRETSAQEREGGDELVVLGLVAERGLDMLRGDSEPAQPADDAVAAPVVQSAAVLGEALRERGVVEVAAVSELADHAVGVVRRDALLGEPGPQLLDRAIAPVERAPGEGPGALEARCGVVGALEAGVGLAVGAQLRPPRR
jgi:hypothetical protein